MARINGNITLNTGGNSEVQNLIIERISAGAGAGNLGSVVAAEKGRILFNASDNIYYYNNGTVWMAFATGGNAATLQTEVDTLELAIGSSVNSDGSYNSSVFAAAGGYIGAATSITSAITLLNTAIDSHNTFAELDDVTLSSLTTGQVPQYNGTKWVNHTLVLTDVSDVTSTTAEVNQLHTSGAVLADFVKLHAVTASAADINLLDGTAAFGITTAGIETLLSIDTTQTIQHQLDHKQPLDPNLTGLSVGTIGAPSIHDVAVATGTNTGTGDTGTSGFTWLTGTGFRSTQGLVIGTDIQAWSTNLDQYAGFTTAADTSETTTINGISTTHTGLNVILVGSGTATVGDYWTEVTGAAARAKLGLGDIAVLDESRFVRADASTTSNIAVDLNLNNFKLTNVAPGTLGQDAVNLNQLEAAITGLTWKNSVQAATSSNITLATAGLPTLDTNYVVQEGDRILVKSQTLAKENGIYVAHAASAWVRATDQDQAAEFDGAAVLVEHGTVYANTAWTVNTAVTTVDTDPVNWVQFNGAAGITAGTGLLKTGNTLSVQLGAGIAELPTSEVGVDIYTQSGAIILTTDGSTRSTDAAAQLHLLLDTTTIYGNLVQSAAGLKLTSNTVGKSEIMAEIAGNGLTGGNGSALSVVTAAGTAATGGDTTTNWAGIGTLDITANAIGVVLGNTSTSAAPGNHTHKAAAITFAAGTDVYAAGTTVQAAIDALDAALVSSASAATTLTTHVGNIEDAIGLVNPAGTFAGFTSNNYVSSSATFAGAINTLDTSLKTKVDDIKAIIQSMYFTGTGTGTTVTFTHNLGCQYVNVTVFDPATKEVIIPQAIVFTDANTVTVTLNVSMTIGIVAMGYNSSLPF